MDFKNKIAKSLVLALTYVNESIKAVDKEDYKMLADNVWHLAAELEYALFLLTITIEREHDKSSWTPGPGIKSRELRPTLDQTKDLIRKITSQMSDNELLDACENTFQARKNVLCVQKYLERKNKRVLRNRKD
jgi:hypothetical protein